MNDNTAGTVIKTCPCCGTRFTTDDLMANQSITPIGLQLDEENPAFSYYYFNHDVSSCGTSFTIQVEVLSHMVSSKESLPVLTGSDLCEQRCVDLNDWSVCVQTCAHAPYRALLRKMLSARGLLTDSARTVT